MSAMFDTFARLLCHHSKVPNGAYSADAMNMLVSCWPKPNEALRLMDFDREQLPIIFVDEPFEKVGHWLLNLFNSGRAMFPVVLMPKERMWDWEEDIEARMLEAYLSSNGMGLTMVAEEEPVMCRGVWVHPCDFRLKFLREYEYF